MRAGPGSVAMVGAGPSRGTVPLSRISGIEARGLRGSVGQKTTKGERHREHAPPQEQV